MGWATPSSHTKENGSRPHFPDYEKGCAVHLVTPTFDMPSCRGREALALTFQACPVRAAAAA